MDEFMRAVLYLIPGASLGEDNDGQIVIYTNLTEDAESHKPIDVDTHTPWAAPRL